MLQSAKFIAFIDPYYDLDKDQFKEVFQECVKIICERPDREVIKLEIHTSIERYFYFDNKLQKSCLDEKPRPKPGMGKPRTDNIEKEKAGEIKSRIFKQIGKEMQRYGIPLQVVVWKERQNGAELHNRYILTDIGGVMFGHGLDRQKKARKGFDDVVCLNSEKGYTERWDDYIGENPAFDKVCEETV
jgi:hypothetical protein